MPLSNLHRGVIALFVSSALFAVMGALVKWAATSLGIDVYKMAVFRFAIGMAILGTAAVFNRIDLKFVASWSLFFRGLLGGIGVVCLYIGIEKLGVARGTVLSYSYPVFATLASVTILREKVSFLKWLAVFAAIGGVILIAMEQTSPGAASEIEWYWYTVPLIGAACAGFAVTLVRKLATTDSAYAIFFSQCLLGFWITVIPANLKPVSLDWFGGSLLVVIGLIAAIGQLVMTYGYAHVPVAVGSVVSMFTPVATAFIGFILFQEPLSIRTILGVTIVIASCMAVVGKKSPKNQQNA